MKHELWRRAEELFHAVLERPRQDRPGFLDEACGDDTELRRLVETLVSEDERASSFLETPVLGDASAPTGVRPSLVGHQYGPYRILSLLGAGGMGEVYHAHDARLGRDVAIKTLPAEFARDPERLERFQREARILASLNHPSVAAIYGLEESPEGRYLVLELVEGETLRGPLPLTSALDRACQVAEALEAAHGHGIIHRDLKPANVKVTPQGRVKVLDFGLAKAISECGPGRPPSQAAAVTGAGSVAGHVVGTPGYMSPEQARGADVDQRTDIWAFGCLFYELLAGQRAFDSETASDAIAAVLEHEPDWQALPAGTPAAVRNVLRRCLEKDPDRRPDSIADVRRAIEGVIRARDRWRFSAAGIRRPGFAIPLAAVLLLSAILGVRFYQNGVRVRWARQQAPEIARLLDTGDLMSAFRLLRRAEVVVPDDPALDRIRQDYAMPMSITTSPPGAEVWATGYTPGDDDWVRLGTTPFTTRRLPMGFYRVRVVKPGFRTVLGTGEVRAGTVLRFDLDAEGTIPDDMVRVPATVASVVMVGDVGLGAFLIDRYETTNRQFRRFVDAGGYRDRRYWQEEFVRDGRSLSREEAMRAFRDTTGLPGPSTWEAGSYPPGRDGYPVSGVSWYEAAAYARFAGRQLPTIYHWEAAADPGWFAAIAQLSNFVGTGPARVGAFKGLGAFGTLDMAGNVREWCWNEVAGRRHVRGGAWDEPLLMFSDLAARSPWDRSSRNGFRLARYDERADATALAPVTNSLTGRQEAQPVSDELFRLYRSLYAYDPVPLDARIEGVDEKNADWKRETVSFASAYPDERITALLYIPKRATPPYQTVLYANPGMAFRLPAQERAEERLFEFVVKSGRALLHPVLKGYYQRRYKAPPEGPNAFRDRLVYESKDFRRCIDYLVARADVDRGRLAVFGYSRGAFMLPVLAVGEERLKAAALVSAGLFRQRDRPAETDPLNFLPRFRVPTLMVSGRFDFGLPPETSQRPMLRLLAAPEPDKKLVWWDGSHGDMFSSYQMMVTETLDWFDRYLGPVK